jgi:predicted GNAT family acetyltransferase
MKRKLGESDRGLAVALLSSAPAINLYMLGNLESMGFDADVCEFWGDFADDGALRGVLNRYMTGWTAFGLPDADWAALGAILDEHPLAAERLQDNPGGVDSFLPFLQRYTAADIHTEEVMLLAADALQMVPPQNGITVRRATLDDLPRLVNLYADAGHMSRSAPAIERPLRATRVWVATEGGKHSDAEPIISVALTNAETCDLAMIGGVFTPPQQRGRGLSQAVCSALCADLIADGKQPVLYWDTPAAGAVYRKLGFSGAGQWRSVWLEAKADRTRMTLI